MHKRTSPLIFQRARELRKNQTPAEYKLWARLRNHQLNGLVFRRQHALGTYILDFCCPKVKLVIELDGHTHGNQEIYDAQRTEWLAKYGWKVLRFTNYEVEHEIEAVLNAILQAAAN